jgi:2-methylcitrate dehydratase PrpD
MAMALLRGRLTSQEYNGAPWEIAEVKSLIERIELVEEPERNRVLDSAGILGVRLVAETTDGGSEQIDVRQPKGHPDAPLSDAELLGKMTWLLEGTAPPHTAERILELCRRLGTAEDVKQILVACNVAAT